MPTRIGEKAQRAFEFLVGLGDPRARRTLAAHNFSDADLEDGWQRLIALSKVPTLVTESPTAAHLAALDAWENRWFPIVDVVLRTNHPRVHEVVFRNLHQTEGSQVLVSVNVLLDRLDAITRPKAEGGLGEAGRRARDHLTLRGLTDEVVDQAREIRARLHRGPSDDELVPDPEARAAAETHLWSWYLEWSGIARATIKDRRVLAALGFRGRGRRKK